MTIPTQHNCPHLGEGWCLECVGDLARRCDDLLAAATEAAELIESGVQDCGPHLRSAARLRAALAALREVQHES